MIGNTLNIVPNGTGAPCNILTSSSATLNLNPNWEITAAYLYWGGSGGTYNFDYDIKLNGQPISAERTFLNDIAGRPVAGGFADVTEQVVAEGNGTYTVSDFDLNNVISAYCANGTNFGGWSILVVYKDETQSNNLVNIYDGFPRVDSNNQYVQFDLDNLNVLNLAGNKIGFLAWEGDANIAVNERLRINNNIVSNPPLNPADNVFNGTNSFTNSTTLYNMDLDLFEINDYTNVGDNHLSVSLQSGQDAVIIHNVALVLNSEMPDATIKINSTSNPCDTQELTVNYTVYNFEATAKLPEGTPIAFFVEDILVGVSETENIIHIGGFEDGSFTLTLPEGIPDTFVLTLHVNNDGTGNNPVIEFDLNNNTDEKTLVKGMSPTVYPYDDMLTKCDTNNNGQGVFDLTLVGDQMLGDQDEVQTNVRYYLDPDDANLGNNNNIPNPAAFINTASPQTIYVRLNGTHDCFAVSSFDIKVTGAELLPQPLTDLVQCSDTSSTTGLSFDLTQNDETVLNGNDPDLFTVSYHLTQEAALSGNNPITNPAAYLNTSAPQTVWARMTDPDGCVHYSSFELDVNPPEPIDYEIPEIFSCSPDLQPTGIIFDLYQNLDEILNGTDPDEVELSFYLSENNATDGINQIPNPETFSNTSNPQTIWVRLLHEDNCVTFGSFIIGLAVAEELPYPISDMFQCSPNLVTTGVIFDLTQNDAEVLNGNNPNQYSVYYYTDFDSAVNAVNPIAEPETYQNIASPQTIWTTLISPDGCIEYGSFEIEASPISEMDYSISDLINCAPEYDLTGIPTDLTQNESEILNGENPNLYTITYHLNLNDAINGVNSIPNPENYVNLSSPQTIWVRAADTEGCTEYGSFEIIYEPAPEAMPASAELCSFDGTVDWYLPDFNALLVPDTSGLTFSYYLTENNAENAVNPLPENYHFTNFPVTVYVRIENDSDCYIVVYIDLDVEINIVSLDDVYRECDSPWEPGDGITQFDLTSRNNFINEKLSLNNSNISYYTSYEAASHGVNPIPNPQNFTNQTNPQTIYARAEGMDGDCGGVAEFVIETLPVPEFIMDKEVEFCYDDSEKYFEFEGDFQSYTWYDPNGEIVGNEPLIDFDNQGTYVLEVTQSGFECPAKREIQVIFETPPIITGLEINGNTVYVDVSSNYGPFKYSIDNGLTWQDYSVIDALPHGYYDLIVMSRNGCVSDSYRFAVLQIPNVITPNGDGINDYWEIRGIELYPNPHVQIFDRYGKLFIDRPMTADFRWDGTYKGDPVPTGTYWYIITMDGGQKITGPLSVKRIN